MKLRIVKKVMRNRYNKSKIYDRETIETAKVKYNKQWDRWHDVRSALYEQGYLSIEQWMTERWGKWDPSYHFEDRLIGM